MNRFEIIYLLLEIIAAIIYVFGFALKDVFIIGVASSILIIINIVSIIYNLHLMSKRKKKIIQ